MHESPLVSWKRWRTSKGLSKGWVFVFRTRAARRGNLLTIWWSEPSVGVTSQSVLWWSRCNFRRANLCSPCRQWLIAKARSEQFRRNTMTACWLFLAANLVAIILLLTAIIYSQPLEIFNNCRSLVSGFQVWVVIRRFSLIFFSLLFYLFILKNSNSFWWFKKLTTAALRNNKNNVLGCRVFKMADFVENVCNMKRYEFAHKNALALWFGRVRKMC